VADSFQLGDSGPEVAELQQRLVALGYQLPVTGSYDEETYESIKSYQQYCGVEVTGIADPNTLSYLEAHASTAEQGTYDQESYYQGGGYEQGGQEQGGYEQGGYEQGGYQQGGYESWSGQPGQDHTGYDPSGYGQG